MARSTRRGAWRRVHVAPALRRTGALLIQADDGPLVHVLPLPSSILARIVQYSGPILEDTEDDQSPSEQWHFECLCANKSKSARVHSNVDPVLVPAPMTLAPDYAPNACFFGIP